MIRDLHVGPDKIFLSSFSVEVSEFLADLSSFSSVMLCAYFLFLKFELYFGNGSKYDVGI